MPETLFAAASLVAVAAWLLLAAALWVPAGPLRARLLALGGRQVPLALCALYAGVLIAHWGPVPGGGFASLHSVGRLFAVPEKMLGGWLHFLAFDLLAARGVIDHGLAQGHPRALLLAVLPLLFLYGPLGLVACLLLAAGVQAARRRRA